MMDNKMPKELTDKARGRQIVKTDTRQYDWTQTLDEIIVYVKIPDGVTKKNIKIHFTNKSVEVKFNNTIVLKADVPKTLNLEDTLWTIEDDEICLQLQKAIRAEVWEECFVGDKSLDPFTLEEQKKKVMLERFARENPGMNFDDAEFSGMVQDPNKFMGGMD
mmetsp:Transcript_30354/g.25614  ORF Transcript_30354/g.25614 Transcript_30354/m.25614 type:complete len:162 (+) Transcript_30354:3-488(+)